MLTGVKSKDFLVYNIDEFTVTNDPIKGTDLFEIKSSFTSVLKELKSQAWSSNCRWLFVFQDEGIYLINVYEDVIWLCRKHSTKFIDMFINNLEEK